ncbi:MAG: choice-of-anchor tandem repeat GloVer-containing protein [Limisphaerales bacterium]
MISQRLEVVSVLLVWLGLATAGLSQSNVQTFHGLRPAVTGRLKPLARLAPETNLTLEVGLPLRNTTPLTHLLRDLYDPASPRFHQYLTPAQFAERFGPSEEDYQAVIRFATSHGLLVTATQANRTLLHVAGSVANIETAFHVRMEVYQHPREARRFFAPATEPSIDLAVPILAINGLDDFLLPRPMNLKRAVASTNRTAYLGGSGPLGNFFGNDFRAAYAPGVALNGAGQSVGLFEMDGYYASDIAQYESLANLPNVTLTNVLLDGFSGAPGAYDAEVTLDIDMAICMAPGLSKVIVYEGTTIDHILNQMALDNLASQLSCSWAFDKQTDPIREQIYEQFAAQGQTMFQAAGDLGAYAGPVEPPSDDPNITVVGGTTLRTSGPAGSWSAETAWSASGGGASTTFPLPAWQEGLSTSANQGSLSFRNIPDVAAHADPTIWIVAFNGEQGATGGTSASAPLWAGFAALANQQAAAAGKPPLGFLNPALYAIGRSAGYAAAFHDIAAGNNTNSSSPANFFAVPGYDLCTGWGTPAGSNLINALVSPPDPLQVFPAVDLTAGGPLGGPLSPAAQDMALTNIGLSPLNWAASNAASWLNVSPTSGTLAGGAGTVVTLSLNSAAGTLPPGSYEATLGFTHLNDGFVENRHLLLSVSVTSSIPAIITQPVSQTVLPGATAIFTVAAVGDAPLSYQWQEDSANLSDSGNISGSATATLTVSNVSSASAGTYSVIVSNSLKAISSSGAVLTVPSVTAPGVTFSTLYSFTGAADGGRPNGLMQETNGNLYGTTLIGGLNASGTVFQMTPAGVLRTLFRFDNVGNDGFHPSSALVQGADGHLYGTTEHGGAYGEGIIFKITTNGTLSTVATFTNGDGAVPDQAMTVGTDGNFYGTTSEGGANGDGEVFRLTPNGTLSVLASFDSFDGLNPNKLAQGIDGSFYGTTFDGGTNSAGSIFKVATNGALTSLFEFSVTNGGFLPSAGLTQIPNGTFYGTTYEGGTFGYGTVFTLSPSGAVTSAYSFTGGNDGGHPAGDLLQASDGNLYGTTVDGGANNDGTVFRIAPGGSPATLASFDGYNGANPEAPLVQANDGSFYGTTQDGGASDSGVIFRVSINSPSVQISGQPAAQTVFLGGTVVFSVAVLGNAPLFYRWLKNGTDLVDGGSVAGSSTRILTLNNIDVSDSALYSVTVSNATGSAAVSDGALLKVVVSPPQITSPPASQTLSPGSTAVFNVTVVGDLPLTYQWQSNQINLTDGANVSGATTSSLTLTGVAQNSDATYTVIVSNAAGVASADATLLVIPVSAPGTSVSSLYWFTGGADGGAPNGLLLASNGMLYGTTQSGGSSGNGTIFSITTNGFSFHTLASFGETNGSSPQTALVQGADGNLYGTTEAGGADAKGTLFKMTLAGSLNTLVSLSNKNNISPYTALVQGTNGNFYGVAENGNAPGDGAIYSMTPDGTVNIVYSFTGGLDGNSPVGPLALGTDGNFYGMTTNGGAHGHGDVFRVTPDGTLTNLYSFTGGADGYNPDGALVQGSDGDFYGVTRLNVISGFTFYGTIFKISTNGALTTLYALNPAVTGDGTHPFAGLIQGLDGNFYGSTLLGGSNNDGTVFRISPAGSFSTLLSFDGSDDGAEPTAAMVQDADGNLYGTTTLGGLYGKGSIFKLTITSAPQITLQPSNQTAFAGTSLPFSAAAFGASPLNFQWRKNGGNLTDDGHISGSASRILTVYAITPNDAGTYSVIVSNALGSVASAGAMLVVVSPPLFQSAIQAGGMLTLTWSAAPDYSYQLQSAANLAPAHWVNLGPAITATNSTLSASSAIDSSSQRFYRVLLLP